VKVKLVVVLAIATIAWSERSFPHTHQPSDVKSLAQAGSAASAAKQVAPAAQGDSRESQDTETVIVDLPFPFLEIDPSLAEYLGLTSSQIRSVQQLVSQERQELEPLMTQLQSTHEKLLAAVDRGQSTETRVLAATEARILTKLLIKSAHMQAKRHSLLTREQQLKLEGLNRTRRP